MTPTNLFANLPSHLPDELFTTLLETAEVRVERIISHRQASPAGFWYNQDQHEWVVVLKGEARLRFEAGRLREQPAAEEASGRVDGAE